MIHRWVPGQAARLNNEYGVLSFQTNTLQMEFARALHLDFVRADEKRNDNETFVSAKPVMLLGECVVRLT